MKAVGIIFSLLTTLVVGFAMTRDRIVFTVEEVTSIYDGDTFTIRTVNGAKQSVRFRGVDTPELIDRNASRAGSGPTSKEFVVARVRAAQRVTLLDIDKTGDRYGRWLAWVYVDGENLALMTIAAGLGRPYDGGTRESWCG